MIAYCVEEKDAYEANGVIVFADSERDAITKGSALIRCEIDEVTVKRAPDADQYAEGRTHLSWRKPDDLEIYRGLGWHLSEDLEECYGCGLYPMGLKEYIACEECGFCPECGHEVDCSHATASVTV